MPGDSNADANAAPAANDDRPPPAGDRSQHSAVHPPPAAKTKTARYDRAMSAAHSGDSDSLRTADSLDLEKDALRYDRRCSSGNALETAHHAPYSPRESRHSRHDSLQMKHETYEPYEAEEIPPLNKALTILIVLCGPLSAICIFTLFWMLLAVVYSVVVQSCRALAGKQNFKGHLTALLAPAYRLQSRCIYLAPTGPDYKLGKLLLVILLSPFLSLGMAMAGGVAAMFWACSTLIGNPAGADNANDGREAVMTLRRWWRAWLTTTTRN